MLSVSTATMRHYINDESLHKEIQIRVFRGPKFGEHANNGTGVILNNDDIVAESFELEQNLCDGEVDYVGCVSSLCKFTLYEDGYNQAYILPTLGKYMVEVTVMADGCDDVLVFTGYTSDSDANFMDGTIECTCYDLIGTDWLSDWEIGEDLYRYLNDSPMTIRQILNFLENRSNGHLKFNYTKGEFFVNGYLEANDCIKSMKGLDILKYMCQMNGLFGVINNEGEFEFRKINQNGLYAGTYPSSLTYPSATLYPGAIGSGMTGDFILIPYETMESYDRMTFEEPPVQAVKIMETESTDVNKDADNRKDVDNIGGGLELLRRVIKIVGNPFLHDRPSSYKLRVCNHVLDNAGGNSYTNFRAVGKGLPFVEVGDYVDYIVTDWNKDPSERHERKSCLVLHRKLKGIQYMTDEYNAQTIDVKEWNKNMLCYICALSGATSVENDIRDSDYEDTAEEIAQEAVQEAGNIWNVISCDFPPENPDPNTIYFIRGIILTESVQEEPYEYNYDDYDWGDEPIEGGNNEGQTDE